MAGWSTLTNGSALDCREIANAYQSNGLYLSNDNNSVKDGVFVGEVDEFHDDYEDKLRTLFDQVLLVFLKDISSKGVFRSFPAMLGDGRSLDLFKLFWGVRKRGGFDRVSKKGLWAYVAEELGLDRRATPSLKLICSKYVNELEKWFKQSCKDRKLGNGQFRCDGDDGDCNLLSLEVETEFRGLLAYTSGKKKKIKSAGLLKLVSEKSGKYIHMDVGKSRFDLSDTKNACRMQAGVGKSCCDDDENIFSYDVNDHVILDSCFSKKEYISRKRKRESLEEMLKWLTQIAKRPDDPSIGVIPEPSKWKEHGGEEFWGQVITAREALFLRRHVNPKTEESLLEKKFKMHPSMYEDSTAPSHHSTERLRCSERLPTLAKCRSCCCCDSGSATQSKLSTHKIELDNGLKEQEHVTVGLPATSAIDGSPEDHPHEKEVSQGPDHQAEVPEWTGVVSESDSKWLGTCVWPLEHEEHNSPIERDPIGRGRPDLCGCRLPGSVECVRFHIAEKRMKLKLELGLVFYYWKFDHMGEEVSLKWTAVEEKRFKDMVMSNLWNQAFKSFPRKTRENLVSYYFNVLLVQRRRYQNRVTPKDVDSDDDELEFGSLSGGFGLEAIKVPGSNFLECSQNKQCTDFE
ncbi:hypothetical protein CMV_004406 [Castanea mollissima]|uniref:ARID domain-containing protein n=1 Tax=Castanea mollissima TaxID=60419 RepID=A0A8J4VVB6_9ROSI|nr:hypothetical protein CMV_004406 [Castanea mollissima]